MENEEIHLYVKKRRRNTESREIGKNSVLQKSKWEHSKMENEQIVPNSETRPTNSNDDKYK